MDTRFLFLMTIPQLKGGNRKLRRKRTLINFFSFSYQTVLRSSASRVSEIITLEDVVVSSGEIQNFCWRWFLNWSNIKHTRIAEFVTTWDTSFKVNPMFLPWKQKDIYHLWKQKSMNELIYAIYRWFLRLWEYLLYTSRSQMTMLAGTALFLFGKM